jgi:hypothetical protein
MLPAPAHIAATSDITLAPGPTPPAASTDLHRRIEADDERRTATCGQFPISFLSDSLFALSDFNRHERLNGVDEHYRRRLHVGR